MTFGIHQDGGLDDLGLRVLAKGRYLGPQGGADLHVRVQDDGPLPFPHDLGGDVVAGVGARRVAVRPGLHVGEAGRNLQRGVGRAGVEEDRREVDALQGLQAFPDVRLFVLGQHEGRDFRSRHLQDRPRTRAR